MDYFIDTNVFLRTLVKEDQKSFNDCTEFLSAVHRGDARALTSPLVLAEIHWVLSSFYRFEKMKIAPVLESILNLKHLSIDGRTDATDAVSLFHRLPIKFIDCLLAAHPLVRSGTAVIVSYDRDFDKIPEVRREEPSEILQSMFKK